MSPSAPASPEPEGLGNLLTRLRTDTPFYAEMCLKIIDNHANLIPLKARSAQLRLNGVLEKQRKDGKPMRAIILKARQLGFSTWVQAVMFQRTTLRSHQRALIVAQDRKTAGRLFEMTQTMYTNLPADPQLQLRPPLRSSQQSRYLHFGLNPRQMEAMGEMGLDSSILVDGANEMEAGRGFTFQSLHLSEVALWANASQKLTGLLQTVPENPDSMIIMESTARGHNDFKNLWDDAESGESDYAPVFFPWYEHPEYKRPFLTVSQEKQFSNTLEQGEFGEGEERLIEEHGVTLEQLAWRRWAIKNKCQGELRIFHQEFPSTPSEAFVSTSNRVFNPIVVNRIIEQTTRHHDPRITSEENPGPKVGELRAQRSISRQAAHLVQVPQNPYFVAHRDHGSYWRIFEEPTENGQYVAAVDVSGGIEAAEGKVRAQHAIVVIDHTTRDQVAEYRSLVEEHLLAEHAYLTAMYYNNAWLAVEMTGHWGLPIARVIWQDYKYPFSYFRRKVDGMSDRQEDRVGWDTNKRTKPLLEAIGREIIAGDQHGIRSRRLALEMLNYVKNERGKSGPAGGQTADLLMAWLIAQQVANEKPLRVLQQRYRTYLDRPRDPITRY